MTTLVLTLLGSPAAALEDGHPVTPPLAAKSLALLAFLTLEPGSTPGRNWPGCFGGNPRRRKREPPCARP